MQAPEPTQNLKESARGFATIAAILCGQVMAVWAVINWTRGHEKEKSGRQR